MTVRILFDNVSNPGPQLPPVVKSSKPSNSPQARGKPAKVETTFAVPFGTSAFLNDMFKAFLITADSMRIIGKSAINIAGNVKKIIGTPALAKAGNGVVMIKANDRNIVFPIFLFLLIA